jgi:membrane-associated phospholipid phosphatase
MEIPQKWKNFLSGAVAVLLLALAITFTLLLNGGGFPTTMLPFDLKDRTLSYPILKDTIGGVTNVVVNTIITIGLVIAWLCCYKENYGSNKALFYLIIYMVLMGGVLVNLLTNFIKHYRGGLRPHFLAACIPNKTIVDSLSPSSWVNLATTKIICTSKEKLDYRWSFPSGHSSEVRSISFLS